jgi:hypothetical protein
MFCRTPISGGIRRATVALLLSAVVATGAGMGTGSANAAAPQQKQEHVSLAGLLNIPACNAFTGAHELGEKIKAGLFTVYACGPRPNWSSGKNLFKTVFPYLGSIARYPGYQCVELTARYLAAAYGAFTGPGIVNGAQVVDNYARRYPNLFTKRHNGSVGHAPVRGDVMSFAKNGAFTGVGHSGVVLGSSVNSKGNGTVTDMEQNYGGPGGTNGKHVYVMKNWRIQWKQMPHAEWLHAHPLIQLGGL